MDNASKALIIAGSILVALLILTLLVAGWNNLSNVREEQQKAKLEEQVKGFNQQYEAFNRSLLYHTDIITVINKALDHNYKNSNKIQVIVETEDEGIGTIEFINCNESSKTKEELFTTLGIELRKDGEYEFTYYECTKCEYSGPDNRISKMQFKEITSEVNGTGETE